ncbi:hypothetical protein ACOZWO_002362, partial [Cronobacter sakazakii]
DAFHEKNAAYRQASHIRKPRSGGVFALWVGQRGMIVHDAFYEKNAAYRQALHFRKTPLRRGFCFMGGMKMNDRPRRFL